MTSPQISASELLAILIDKAVNAQKSEDAMRFSQSALNAAHALKVLDISNVTPAEVKQWIAEAKVDAIHAARNSFVK